LDEALHAARRHESYIRPECYILCYEVLSFKRYLPDRPVKPRSGSRQACRARRRERMKVTPGRGPGTMSTEVVQPGDRGTDWLTSWGTEGGAVNGCDWPI
jgi:hypothetical protein